MSSKKCPRCEEDLQDQGLVSHFCPTLQQLCGPISQPDGYAAMQGITPEHERNAGTIEGPIQTVHTNILPRTATGYTLKTGYMREVKLHPVTGHIACSGPCCIPELYQPGMQKGGPIGLRFPVGQLQGGVNNTQPYQPAELYSRPEIQQALDSMIRNFEGVVRLLQERIEYAELQNDAYRKVWSAREYLGMLYPSQFNVSQNEGYGAAYRILTNALQQLEIERVDGDAIRAKYKEIK